VDLSAPEVPDADSGMIASVADGAADQVADSAVPEVDTNDLAISADPAQPSLPEVETGAGLAPAAADEAEREAAEVEPMPEPTGEGETPGAEMPDTEIPRAEMPAAETQTDQAETETAEEAPAPSTIGNLATNIETGRLPSVGSVPADVEPDAPDVPAETRAIALNAMPFENPEGKPLMSIVLIDDGTSPIGREALDAFPYPLSFAVDATAPGAAEAMARYRAAGFEVLAIADLPEGADARDTETVMQTVFAAVPRAVAILEGTGAGLQTSRDASEQLAPILLESGHGLVVFAKGLQTAPKLIAREGVPVGTVFRDFDSAGQSATVIRRFLDQAAFKATREEGGVIMLGRLRADTISALLLWGLQDRASSVALAPVSAVLLAED
jgi:polysaccharide deacetylase 2 family uncharacterized protein YibQ